MGGAFHVEAYPLLVEIKKDTLESKELLESHINACVLLLALVSITLALFFPTHFKVHAHT
jgi:hypothetical protein